MKTSPAVETGRADLELISIGDGRPSVVRIMTYDPSQSTLRYPAIMLQGTTTATTAAALANQSVECDMYFQASASSAIAMTPPGGSVSVSFGSLIVEDNALPGSLSQVTLIGSDFQKLNIPEGEIVAVIRSQESGR